MRRTLDVANQTLRDLKHGAAVELIFNNCVKSFSAKAYGAFRAFARRFRSANLRQLHARTLR